MSSIRIRSFAAALALLAVSCAGTAKLARPGEAAPTQGGLRRAYDRALRAIEQDPQNAKARAAYTTASNRVAADWRMRVVALAAADSSAAADLAIEYRTFRTQVGFNGSALMPDPAYDAAERRLLLRAARIHDALARAAFAARRPKAAWREIGECRRYVDDYAGAVQLQEAAYREALTRVVVLPFASDGRLAGLEPRIQHELADAIAVSGGGLHFTQLVTTDGLDVPTTVAGTNGPAGEGELGLGRRLGVDRIVTARAGDVESNTDTRDLTLPIYRRTDAQDDQGHTVERWSETTLHVVTRERDVNVRYAVRVIDSRSGAVLAHREPSAATRARTMWTDFVPDGDCDRYALLPPDVRQSDPDRARRVDARWQERLGSWTLPEVLQLARDQRDHAHYDPRDRARFDRDTRDRPVWLGELPAPNELACVALDDAWKTVLTMLQELDTAE
ncbi:MAG TPA: hypothetical protein VMH61_04830 [Candidatus Acidoferrales bacterium]|nr:hypothetical protein [Candidatus Acidoferrales bacterium]